jgi:recombination protein RecA
MSPQERKKREERIKKICANINEEMKKEDAVTYIGSGDSIAIERFPSGSPELDRALGGGWPRGRFIELMGPEAGGKTTICLHGIAEFQKYLPDEDIALVDVEHSFDEKYAKAIGVDIDLILVNQPESGEEALNVVRKLVHNNVGLIIVDSVAALVPQAELDGDIGDVHVAQQARLMSQAMRMLCAEAGSRKVTIFWTNQMRDKIGTFYGEKTTTPGGRALRHYASVRVSISPIARIKDGEEVVGTKVRADVKKNKVAAPFKKAEFYISFGTGIDRVAALCDEAIARKVVKKHRKQIFLPSADNPKEGEILGEGRLSFIETVKNNKKLFDQLDELVKKAPPPESEEAKAADEGEGEKTAETDAGKKIKKPKSMGGDVTRVPVTEDNALPDGDEAGAQVETTDV